jgi:prevent-host-death family protein
VPPIWSTADARKKFEKLFERALREGPQKITDGNDTVVVLSRAEYDRLRTKLRKSLEIED